MKKWMTTFVLAMTVLCMLMPSALAWDPATGDYNIATLAELEAFRNAVNGGNSFAGITVKLTASIDMSSVTSWVPIGVNKTAAFKGTFDGQGNTISNLTINDSSLVNAGLFGYASDNGSIKNLTIKNVNITAKSGVGAVIGDCIPFNFENITVTGDIQITGNYKVGGIAGGSYVRINNCHVSGNSGSAITGEYAANNFEGDNVGGIVGYIGEGASFKVTNSSVSGVTVTGTRKVGGAVGSAFHDNTISGSVSNVTVGTTATEDYANSKQSTMGVGGMVGLFTTHTGNANAQGSLSASVNNVTLTNQNNVNASMGVTTGGQRGANSVEEPKNVDVTGTVSGTNTGANNTFFADAVRSIAAAVVAYDAPRTGDETPILLLAALLMISGCMLLVYRKRFA